MPTVNSKQSRRTTKAKLNMVFIQPGPIAASVFSCTGKPRVVQGGFILYTTKAKEGDTMEQKLRIPEGDGKRLLIALGIGLIN